MISEYRCSNCSLFFSTGWYHFHTPQGEYAAASYFVCMECGLMHRLDHSITYSTGLFYKSRSILSKKLSDKKQEKDRLYVQPELIFCAVEVSEQEVLMKDWKEVLLDFDPRANRTPPRKKNLEGLNCEFDYSGYSCLKCNSKNSLLINWPKESNTCPNCHSNGLKLHSCTTV